MEIRLLTTSDSKHLFELLNDARPDYIGYFTPFKVEQAAISNMLASVTSDRYWGIFHDSTLTGFFMLRGFDAGYKRPSYGVFIAEVFAGNGLLKLSLNYVRSWCRLNGVGNLMLKVHPDNTVARRSYEAFGFSEEGFDEKNGNIMYNLKV